MAKVRRSFNTSQGVVPPPIQAPAPAAPAPAPVIPTTAGALDVSTLQAMDDAQLTSVLNQVFSSTKTDPNQQNTDTQRFFNAIGWTDHLPRVLSEAQFEGAIRQVPHAIRLFHTDDTTAVASDARVFADQFMGAGKQFLSGGIHGDGTYFAKESYDSWGYGGSRNATQFKAFLSSRAKVINEFTLDSMVSKFKRSHPQAYHKLVNHRGVSGYGGIDSAKSIIAAMYGYNVIQGYYYTVLDRSAVTVSKTVIHRYSSDTNARTW